MKNRFLAILLLLFSIIRCADGPAEDRELARVYDKSLKQSAVKDIVPEGTNPSDSALIVSAYVQRWARDQLLMYEAERNLPKDLNIDEMVRAYRASLLRYNFEEQLIAAQLDSTVADDNLRQYFEEHREQFRLNSPILQLLLIKIPVSLPQQELIKIWNGRKDSDFVRLNEIAAQSAVLSLLDREKWYRLEDVAPLLPKETLTEENLGSRREGVVTGGDFKYYYRVLSTVGGENLAPFEFAKDQVKTIILHKRKQELLEKWQEDLYQKELRRENIKILQ